MSSKIINQINDATIYKSGINITQNPEWADIYGKPSGLTQKNINQWITISNLWNGETGELEIGLASKDKAGIVQIGEGINVSPEGIISVDEVDVATTGKAGIVKPNDDFDIAPDGTLSLYKPISISSYSISPNLVEVGYTVTSVTPSFMINKPEGTAKINGTTATNGTPITGSWTTNTDFNLEVTDSRGKTASSKQTLQFGYYLYITTNGLDYTPTAAQIKLYSKELKTSFAKKYTTTTNGYVYLAVPAEWGTPKYSIGVSEYSFIKIKDNISISTSSNTTDYNVYRTGAELSPNVELNIK